MFALLRLKQINHDNDSYDAIIQLYAQWDTDVICNEERVTDARV